MLWARERDQRREGGASVNPIVVRFCMGILLA
jgi:hypothetical protein